MKLVQLTAADLEKLRNALPTDHAPPQTFHHEELRVDSVSIALVRPSASTDPRTNTYSIGFQCGDSEYVIIVRPTVHQIPSITLDIIHRVAGKEGDAEFASYTVLSDTVTTLKGQASGLPAGLIGTTSEFATLIGHVKVQ